MDADITPFRIDVADADLADLRTRLAKARFPEAETVPDWRQGVPLAYLKELCDYWQREYDWRRAEASLNALPQFKTVIDGVAIHFIDVPSKVGNAMPLLLTHGWPGSVVEFLKAIGPLTDPLAHGGTEADAFHLVLPTLPGYGFSDKPTAPGWGVERIAAAWSALAARLGYMRYFASGGDWGAAVAAVIGATDTAHCAGVHVTMPVVAPPAALRRDPTPLEEDADAARQFYQDWDSGYAKQQSTRPQTLGYGLADSPVGQAAWIIEKFHQWADCDGHPENVFSRDELLDNVMLYWLTGSAASSARLYWESFGKGSLADVVVPSGASIFPKEIFKASPRWLQTRFKDLRYYNVLDRGGHFAAFERPRAFVQEVRACFRAIRAGWRAEAVAERQGEGRGDGQGERADRDVDAAGAAP